jgi:Zn-dependent protease with chaperone function
MPISSDLVDNFRINVGRFWNGETAREQPVSVFIEPDGLLIESHDETIVRWPSGGLCMVGRREAGRWFCIRSGTGAARLQLPPRMYDRILHEYGPLKQARNVVGMKLSLLLLFMFGMLLSGYAGFLLPKASQGLASLVSLVTINEFGRQHFENFVAQRNRSRRGIEFCVAPAGLKALSKLTNSMAGLLPDLSPNVVVVQRRRINASSLGGGYAVIYSDLIDYVRSDAELIGVIAHEMGHGVGRHGLQGMLEAVVLLNATGMLSSTLVPSIGYILTSTGPQIPFHSQAREREADRAAIAWLLAMSVDPTAMGDLMLRFAADEGELNFLDEHPTYAERSAMFYAAAMKGYPLLTPDEWRALKSICRVTTKTAPVSPPEPS